MSEQMFNVSVRLTNDEKNKLDYLMKLYTKGRVGRVTQADILRHAIEELYITEFEKKELAKKEQPDFFSIIKNATGEQRELLKKMLFEESASTIEEVEQQPEVLKLSGKMVTIDKESGEILEDIPTGQTSIDEFESEAAAEVKEDEEVPPSKGRKGKNN